MHRFKFFKGQGPDQGFVRYICEKKYENQPSCPTIPIVHFMW